jgi:hypothetical protein
MPKGWFIPKVGKCGFRLTRVVPASCPTIQKLVLDCPFSRSMEMILLPDMLVVGSYFPAGTLPKFTDELKRRMEADARRDLGPEYSVLARYTALAPSIEGIELTVMKVKP